MTTSSVVVTGSIANYYLRRRLPGRSRERLVGGRLDDMSSGLPVGEAQIFHGGSGANIAFGLGGLGRRPYLVGAVGSDFAKYRVWLEEHGVDTSHVLVSAQRDTARFVYANGSGTDRIASRDAGAMVEARDIDLGATLAAIGRADLVMISPDDPGAMLRHTRACRELGVPFAAAPSQHMVRMADEDVRDLVDGARWLFTNQYERDLLLQKTGWSEQGVLERVGSWVVTLGEHGLQVHTAGGASVSVPAHTGLRPVDPTGVGDALRAGFLAGMATGLDVPDAARIGCTVAGFALETLGAQEYTLAVPDFLTRVARTYGDDAATRAEALLEQPEPAR